MRVAVPEAVDADLLEVGAQQHAGELRVVVLDEGERRQLGDLAPAHELRRQHPRGGHVVHHAGDVDLRERGEVVAQDVGVARLLQVIQLVRQRDPGLLDGADEVQLPGDLGVLVERMGDVVEHRQLLAHLLAHVRALDLHDDVGAVAEDGAVGLAERCGSERGRLEALEGLRDAHAELLLDDALDVGERERFDGVLQRFELGDVLGRDDVGPRRQDLSELHVGRTHRLQRLGERLGAARDVRLHRLVALVGDDDVLGREG